MTAAVKRRSGKKPLPWKEIWAEFNKIYVRAEDDYNHRCSWPWQKKMIEKIVEAHR